MSSMQRNSFAWIIFTILVYSGPSCGADVETVLRTVGENVTLECPELLSDELYGSQVWRHNGQLLASMTTSRKIDIVDNTMKDKVTILSDMTLDIPSVSREVKGSFDCTLDFTKNGNVSSKTTAYNLLVQDIPDRPKKPKVGNVTSSQATVSWESPDSHNSPIKSYIVNVLKCSQTTEEKEMTAPSDARQQTVDGLDPYTCYKVTVSAINSIGTSGPSTPSGEFYTEQDDSSGTAHLNSTTTTDIPIPKAVPDNFRARPFRNEIHLLWEKPRTQWKGEILGYEIRYGKSPDNMQAFKVEDPDSTETTLESMDPYTMYTVTIHIYNSVGKGPEKAMEVQTLEGVPSNPRITHISNRRATSFYVNWEPPLVTNGRLKNYKVRWSHNGNSKSRVIAGHLTNPMTAYITDLTPYTSYVVQVAAATEGGYGPFTDTYPALTDVTAPSAPRGMNLTILSKTSIHLKWQEPETVYKRVDSYLIKYWDNRGDDLQDNIKGDVTEYTMTRLTTDSSYHLKVAGVTKTLFSNISLVGDFTKPIMFVLGDYYGKNGDTIYDTNEPDKKAGSIDDSSLPPVIIATIVCALLIVVVAIVLFVGYRFYTCHRCYHYLYFAVPSNGHSAPQTNITVEEPSEEKQYPDVPINDFISHVELMHMDSDIAFAQEFDEINRASNTDKYSCENSNGTDNRAKNRYVNIVAYDHSRVVLKADMGRPRQSDYINANYVDGYKRPKAYIATQGPLPLTFPDFWRMVWEQNTSVIVMITNLMEKGRRKCDQYWPTDGAESYGNIQVKLTTTVPRAHYTVRIFTLKNLKVKKRHSMKGNNERTVYHYHYTEWPDHGVPDYSLPVLDFVQKSAAHSGLDSGPIVVHCSAGVGRTGTYILIDSMIAQIQDKGTINIPGFTQYIRRQRNYLVQTEDQYIFIHSVLVEYLLGGGSTEVKDIHMSSHLLQLEEAPPDQLLQSLTDTSLLQKQFQLVTSYRPSDADLYAAQRECNQPKNREGSLLPVNLKRVLLPARPGVEGSDYINASYLQGYERSGEFVVTQHPTDDTVEDFWRMVWDRNSTVIVVLSPIDDKVCKEFWPPKDNSIEVDAGNFRLAMKEGSVEDEEQGSTTYEFILDSIQYDYTLMTRIICVRDWPARCVELHRVFDVIATAHDYVNSTECGPVVVIDQFGGTAAGTFCALWTLRDHLMSEKCADFYQLAKLYHYKRPGIMGTEEDYFFLHKAVAALCRQLNTTSSNTIIHPHHHLNHYSTNHNANNHNNHHHHNNGTLPRAASASSSSSSQNPSNVSGMPRSSTIANPTNNNNNGATTTTTEPFSISVPANNNTSHDDNINNIDNINDRDYNNDSATSPATVPSEVVVVGGGRNSGVGVNIGGDDNGVEATFMNDMNTSRHSYVNVDSGGEVKLETNI